MVSLQAAGTVTGSTGSNDTNVSDAQAVVQQAPPPARTRKIMTAKESDAESAVCEPPKAPRKRKGAPIQDDQEDDHGKPKLKVKARAKASAAKAKARGLSALKGSTEAKTNIMKSSYTQAIHQAAHFLSDVQKDTEKEWAFAMGDRSGKDDSDYATLLRCVETLKGCESESNFNKELILAWDFNGFKKAKLNELSEEQWETKLDKFNCSLDKPILEVQELMEAMMEQRDFRNARKARADTV